jgi:hypothetical protein
MSEHEWRDGPPMPFDGYLVKLPTSVTAGTPPSVFCPHCSGGNVQVYHSGACPRVRSVEYHENGSIKRIEYREIER